MLAGLPAAALPTVGGERYGQGRHTVATPLGAPAQLEIRTLQQLTSQAHWTRLYAAILLLARAPRRALTALLLTGLLARCVPAPEPQTVKPHAVQRALWVWSNLPVFKGSARQALWADVAKYQFNTLYIQAQTLVYDDQPGLQQLVADAAARQLEVELLAGKHTWARKAEHGAALQVVEDLIQFVATQSGSLPWGIHLDIEPHGLPEWAADPNALANDLLDLLDAVVLKTSKAQLRLNYDMPNWYNDIAVTRHGQTRPLSHWLIDCCDRITLMDYRDTLADQLALADDELAYSRKVGKVLVVGSETACGLDKELTYCEEGQAGLASALSGLGDFLQDDAAYGGVAVHHWGALATLKP